MTQAAVNSAKVLYQLGVDRQDVKASEQIFSETPLLREALQDPTVPMDKKRRMIEKIFARAKLPALLMRYYTVLCENGQLGDLEEILKAYDDVRDQKNNIVRAKLICAFEPDEQVRENARALLKQQFPGQEIRLTEETAPELLGGYKVVAGCLELDRSYTGLLHDLERKLGGKASECN